ncbi:hypothetical protein OJAV_G00155880 [Oryzias javanicus]|uniref:Uncharacterized protein n=1 Tax=Oryzias javanicus TaxID=123683 RepID=A0A437CIA2_ORYJA|nr:hypothetical protein OJAV_G00155880 [Oryzias javanicus]
MLRCLEIRGPERKQTTRRERLVPELLQLQQPQNKKMRLKICSRLSTRLHHLVEFLEPTNRGRCSSGLGQKSLDLQRTQTVDFLFIPLTPQPRLSNVTILKHNLLSIAIFVLFSLYFNLNLFILYLNFYCTYSVL